MGVYSILARPSWGKMTGSFAERVQQLKATASIV
jgi:hypothetical protein